MLENLRIFPLNYKLLNQEEKQRVTHEKLEIKINRRSKKTKRKENILWRFAKYD